VVHQAQTSKKPFEFADAVGDKTAHTYQIATVDAAGRKAMTGDLELSGVA